MYLTAGRKLVALADEEPIAPTIMHRDDLVVEAAKGPLVDQSNTSPKRKEITNMGSPPPKRRGPVDVPEAIQPMSLSRAPHHYTKPSLFTASRM